MKLTANHPGIPRAAAALAVTCWSAGNVIVDKAPMAGLQIAAWRLFYGAVVYFAILYLAGHRTSWKHMRISAACAITIALEIAFFFVAIKETTIANATIIGALQPLVLLVVAARQFNERITKLMTVVSIVAIIGVGFVLFGSADGAEWHPFGDAMAFLAMLLFAAYFVLAKRARATIPAFEFQAVSMLIGAAVIFPILFVSNGFAVEVPSMNDSWWLLLLLAVPGTGHLLMNWAHPKVKLSLTSMLTLAIPVLSTLGGVWFSNETINLTQVAGMAIVLGALAIVIRNDIQTAAAS